MYFPSCPICGKAPEVTRDTRDYMHQWQVTCAHVSSSVGEVYSAFTVIAPTERQAHKEWSKFASLQKAVR